MQFLHDQPYSFFSGITESVDKPRATGVSWNCSKAFDKVLQTILLSKLERIWQEDCLMVMRLYQECGGQWFSVQMEMGDEWCPSKAGSF